MNSDNEDKPIIHYKLSHFFLTQLQTLILAIIITALMQLSNHLAVYLIYCCPVYFLFAFLQYLVFWKTIGDDTRLCFNVFNIFMMYICTPLFFGIFFGIFHPTASLEFKKVENCQLVGSISKSLQYYENYSILYVDFEYEGKKYLGQACSSSQGEGQISQTIPPYQFLHKFDSIACGPDDDKSGGRGFEAEGKPTDDYCVRDYKWSKVKIASWICLQRGFDIESFQEKQTCYVNFFNGNLAIQNGLERNEMKEVYNFPLISYNQHPYYPKADLICLIIFTYYLGILSFSLIFQYSSNFIINKYRNFKKQVQKNALPNDQLTNKNLNADKKCDNYCNNQCCSSEPNEQLTVNQSPNMIPIIKLDNIQLTDQERQEQLIFKLEK